MSTSADIKEVTLELEKILSVTVPVTTYEALKHALSEKVRLLINEDFTALIQLLYRMDVSEQKLRNLFNDTTANDVCDGIAALMIERQLQKISTRKAFSKGDDIPEDEQWQ